MVVTVFRPRLHYKGARAQKLHRKQKFRQNSEFFPAPARFFAARLTAPARAGDPEWGAHPRLPYFAHGTLLWYCTRHGLFAQPIDAHKK